MGRRSRAASGVIAAAVTAIALPFAASGPSGAWTPSDSPPRSTLAGDLTRLYMPCDGVFDATGALYVADCAYDRIFVWDSGYATGNTAPSQTLEWPNNGALDAPSAIAFDTIGRMYVANSNPASIAVYPADWRTGNTTPEKVLSGALTGLNQPNGLTVADDGTMYVANRGADSVTAYASGWATGNTAPSKTLQGSSTSLSRPSDVKLDGLGNLFVANYWGNVTVYPVGWTQPNTAPARSLGVDSDFGPTRLAFDGDGRLLVADYNASRVFIFDGVAQSGDSPRSRLQGATTSLASPSGIALSPQGDLYVTNYGANSVISFSPSALPPTAPTRVRATRGNASATVSWSAPADDGGGGITGYTVIPSTGNSRCQWTSGPLSCTVRGLRNGTTYTFTVVATNEAGDSPASAASGAVRPLPDSPAISSVTPATVVAGSEATITVRGTGFIRNGVSVSLRTVGRKLTCTAPVVTGTTKITCRAPKLSAGAYTVVVALTGFEVTPGTKLNALTAIRPKS